MFSVWICPAGFPGTGERRAAPRKTIDRPEVPSARPARRTTQKRTASFLSPEGRCSGEPSKSAWRRWPLCPQVSQRGFSLSHPCHTPTPASEAPSRRRSTGGCSHCAPGTLWASWGVRVGTKAALRVGELRDQTAAQGWDGRSRESGSQEGQTRSVLQVCPGAPAADG